MKFSYECKVAAIRRKKSKSDNIYCEVDVIEGVLPEDMEFSNELITWESLYYPNDISKEEVAQLVGQKCNIKFFLYSEKRRVEDKVFQNLKLSILNIELT